MITEKLQSGLSILFIGFNPSLTSHQRGFNYAGRNNRFYTILHQSGLTSRLFEPEESPRLLTEYGYGFTNIVSRPTKRADELSKAEYTAGRLVLAAKIKRYRPRVVCFVGKGVYAQYIRRYHGVPWGFQSNSNVDGMVEFVGPSSSGLVRMTLQTQVAIYLSLASFVHGDGA